MSQKQRRWPEDMAWHPEGNSLFSVYNADGGDSQISILNFNRTKEVSCFSFYFKHPWFHVIQYIGAETYAVSSQEYYFITLEFEAVFSVFTSIDRVAV